MNSKQFPHFFSHQSDWISHSLTPSKNMYSLNILNLLMNISGSVSSIINFNNIHCKQIKFIWFIYSIVFGVIFILSYPVAISKLFKNTPSDCKTSINYRLNILFYSFTFTITAIIYFVHFRFSREVNDLQNTSLKYYKKLQKINNKIHSNVCKNISTNELKFSTLIRILSTLFCFIFSSYLKLTQIFHWPDSLNVFDVFWFFYPILFTHLYCNFFSQTIKQQTNLFEILNKTLHQINIIMEMKMNSSHEMMNLSISRKLDYFMIQQVNIISRENDVNELINLHQHLQNVNKKLGKSQSIQVICILLNAFINVVTQLWFVFNDTIEIAFAPVVWMNCVLGMFFIFEIITIITPCNHLKDVVSIIYFEKCI